MLRLRLFVVLLLLALTACFQTTPTEPAPPPEVVSAGAGLRADYFARADFSGQSVTRVDRQVLFDWGQVSPAQGLPPGAFSARWQGTLTVPVTDSYTFFVAGSGQTTFTLDGTPVVSDTPLVLEKGLHNIKLEFVKISDTAALKLEWQNSTLAREVIGQQYLQPATLYKDELVFANVVTSTNLLLNSDFETGTGGWVKYGDSTDFTTIMPGRSGAALKASGWLWVQQDLPVSSIEAGQTYTVRGYGKALSDGICTLGLAGGSTITQLFNETVTFGSGTFLEGVKSVMVPEGTVWLSVYLTTTASECQFDDVTLVVDGTTLPVSGNNVVVNAGFEADFASWGRFGGTSSISTPGQNSSGKALQISNFGWIQQDLAGTLFKSEPYTLSGHTRSVTGSVCTLGLIAANATQVVFDVKLEFTATTWTQKTLRQTFPAGVTWAGVYAASGGADCFFDDISLAPSTSDPTTPQPLTIQLPVEVIGPDDYSEEIRFELSDASGINTLYLQAHRLAYRDTSTNAARGAKGSVRLNGGAWLDLSNATPGLECYDHEQAYGCLNGSYHTVRLTVPITGAVQGENTLEFRFNGTDGFTAGYRVLDFNLRRGSTNVLPASVFVQDDVTKWSTPLPSQADISVGKNLWETKVLTESPVSSKQLKATCSSCHAADGRDLKYFNYSSWAIEARSMFHGLTETEGKQIASYIRSLDVPAPLQARPWNPPYQPGPGLDSKPAQEWAAGAGLEWVLEKDSDMMPYLFPRNGTLNTSAGNLERVMDINASLNIREMPVAIQLPDWNAWLPDVHPIDAWSNWNNLPPHQSYLTTLQTFETQGVTALIANPKKLISTMSSINNSTRDFVSAGATKQNGGSGSPWRTALGDNIAETMNGVPRELVKQSLAQWSAVKQWETVQRYGLESVAPQVLPEGGELRSWPSDGQNVHPIAPHVTADKIYSGFDWQTILVGKYFSSAWYQVQMTINSGQRQAVNVEPQDWPYQFRHIQEWVDESGEPQTARFIQSFIKAYQMRNNDAGVGSNGWQMRVVHPFWLVTPFNEQGATNLWNALDQYQVTLGQKAGMKKRIVSALAQMGLAQTTSFAVTPVSTTTIGDWPICKTVENNVEEWFCLMSPTTTVVEPQDILWPDINTPANLAFTLKLMKERDWVNEDIRLGYIAWAKSIWSQYDWDRYR